MQLRADRLGLLDRARARALGQKIIPSAQAPSSTAWWASSSVVRPQIFTRVMARLCVAAEMASLRRGHARGLVHYGMIAAAAAAAAAAGPGRVGVGRPLVELTVVVFLSFPR